MESAEPHNPYSPPVDVGPALLEPVEGAAADDAAKPRGWGASLLIWATVCIISAAPSFFWGFSTIATNQIAAMSLGIMIFIAIYTVADQLTQAAQWRRRFSTRLTLKIGYGTRIAISIIFPVGGFIDAFCGMLSISLVNFSFPGEGFGGSAGDASFTVTLLITLIQGCVLNVILAGYMLLVFGVVALVTASRR